MYTGATPYHVLQFCAIALANEDADSDGPKILLIQANFPRADELLDALDRWPDGPFDAIHLVPGYRPFKDRFDPHRQDAEVLRVVRSLCQQSPIHTVYTCHDGMLMSQAALRYGKKLWGARGVYLEDGSAAYHGKKDPVPPVRRTLMKRIITGAWWQRYPRVYGTTPWVDERRAIFPDLVRRDLARYEWKPVPAEPLLSDRFGAWLAAFLDTSGVPVWHQNGLDAIVSVAHSTLGQTFPGYANTMKRIVEALRDQGLTVGLKYHPREFEGDYLGLDEMPGVARLHPFIGAEYYFIAGRGRLSYHIGDVTSSLMTARWLLPNATVFSFLPDEARFGSMRRPLEGCGVEVYTNSDELVTRIRFITRTPAPDGAGLGEA